MCLEIPGKVIKTYREHDAREHRDPQVAQISREKETNFRLPVSGWLQMMEMY